MDVSIWNDAVLVLQDITGNYIHNQLKSDWGIKNSFYSWNYDVIWQFLFWHKLYIYMQGFVFCYYKLIFLVPNCTYWSYSMFFFFLFGQEERTYVVMVLIQYFSICDKYLSNERGIYKMALTMTAKKSIKIIKCRIVYSLFK